MSVLENMGSLCKQYRIKIGKYQKDVAHDTGYSVENISAFENGRNYNMKILLWYFDHGMTWDYLYGSDNNDKSL